MNKHTLLAGVMKFTGLVTLKKDIPFPGIPHKEERPVNLSVWLAPRLQCYT